MADQATENPQIPDANQQAKADLPKITAPSVKDALDDPGAMDKFYAEAPSAPTSKLGKAYQAAKNWMGEHEQHLSEKVLTPFRQGLDNMASDLQEAGETGHTKSGGQLNPVTRALASGAGKMLEQVPVGKNVKDTAMAMATNLPELPEGHMFGKIEGVRPATAKEIVEGENLIYKGELTKGSDVHMFEHPDHPGQTASLNLADMTPKSVQEKMNSKIKEFKDADRSSKSKEKETKGRPEYAYRSRDVGEKGVPADARSHAHATMSQEDAERLSPSRGKTTGKPQEIIRFRLDSIRPEDYKRAPGPSGADWVKLNKEVPEEAVETVKPISFGAEEKTEKPGKPASAPSKEPKNESRIVIEGLDTPKKEGTYSDRNKIDPFSPLYKKKPGAPAQIQKA